MGLVLFEQSRHRRSRAFSIPRLLLLAEVELLKSIRSELKRRRGHERRLTQIEDELRELGEDESVTHV